MKSRQIVQDNSMLFERTLGIFFGMKAAYQTAGQESTPRARRDWIRRVLMNAIRRIDEIEVSTSHKQSMMQHAEYALEAIEKSEQPSWKFIYHLIALLGKLLGYQDGTIVHSLSYWQTDGQRWSSAVKAGGGSVDNFYEEKDDAVSIRSNVVGQLKKQGLSDFKISLVLHTTEYKVRQLRRGL